MLKSFEDENVREKWKFIINSSIAIVTAIVGLIYGTGYLDKLDKKFELSSKFAADTSLSKMHNISYSGDGEVHFCEVTGQYSVTNIGEYPYTIKSVSFKLWEIPYLEYKKLSKEKITSFTLDQRLKWDKKEDRSKI